MENRGYLLCEGVDTDGKANCTFKIAYGRLDYLKSSGPEYKYYELFSACEVLKSPLAIFQDLKRDGQEEGLCYIGRPRVYGDGVERPPHPGLIFVVYLTKRRVIFEWGWEREDKQHPGYPENARIRFGKILWQHSSTT